MAVQPEQFMSPEQITVSVFFLGSAVVIALDALKQSGARAKALWSVSVAFVMAGFFVKPLWNVFPDVSQFLAGIAAFPPTWFFLAVGGYLAIRAKLPLKQETLDDVKVTALIDQRFAALPAPAQSSSEALLSELNEKLAAQSKFISDHQMSLGHALDERFAEMEKEISRREPDVLTAIVVSNQILAERRKDLVSELKELLTVYETQLPQRVGELDMRITFGLRALGCGADDVQRMVQARIDDIKSNTDYITLREDEKSRWATGADKKKWHSDTARLYVYRQLMAISEPPKPPSVLEFFGKVEQVKDEK